MGGKRFILARDLQSFGLSITGGAWAAQQLASILAARTPMPSPIQLLTWLKLPQLPSMGELELGCSQMGSLLAYSTHGHQFRSNRDLVSHRKYQGHGIHFFHPHRDHMFDIKPRGMCQVQALQSLTEDHQSTEVCVAGPVSFLVESI